MPMVRFRAPSTTQVAFILREGFTACGAFWHIPEMDSRWQTAIWMSDTSSFRQTEKEKIRKNEFWFEPCGSIKGHMENDFLEVKKIGKVTMKIRNLKT